MKKTWLFVIAVLAVIAFALGGTYNGLVSSQNAVTQAQSDVQVDLQRRYDLIPNVVNSVKGYMSHESEIFEKIADARAKIGSGNASEAEQGQSDLSSAVSRLLVLTENYPDLKANQQVENLITELEGTENRIKTSRGVFNEVATKYNTKVRSFPTNLVAGIFGFQPVNLYQASSDAQVAPTVDLNSSSL